MNRPLWAAATLALAALLLPGSGVSAQALDVAPTGTLRVALNVGNPVLASRDPATGEARGVAVDLGRALAAAARVPFGGVEYPGVPPLLEGLRAGAWDLAFLAIDPAREGEVDFTAPYMEVAITYLVPPDSPIRAIADADQVDSRIAVGAQNAADLYLSRTLAQAQLVRATTADGVFELVASGQANAVTANYQELERLAPRLPGWRIVEGRYTTVQHAIAVPKGRPARLAYLQTFVEQAKASGLVRQALARHAIRGVQVAPPTRPTGLGLPRTGDASAPPAPLPVALTVGALLVLVGRGLRPSRHPA